MGQVTRYFLYVVPIMLLLCIVLVIGFLFCMKSAVSCELSVCPSSHTIRLRIQWGWVDRLSGSGVMVLEEEDKKAREDNRN